MKARVMVLAAGLAGAGAWGQAPSTTGSTVTYTITWEECDLAGQPLGGNGNGILQPGEGVLIRMTASFTGQNTTASYTPPTPAPGSGTIRGLGSGFLDLHVTSNAGGQGQWLVSGTGLGVLPAWDLVGPGGWGTPANGGANLLNIQFGQFPVNPGAVVTTNPIGDIWRGAWIPASYTVRDITFTTAPAAPSQGVASSVIFKTSTTQIAGVNALSVMGSVTVPIPGPGVLGVMGVGGVWLGRRGRKLPNCQRAK